MKKYAITLLLLPLIFLRGMAQDKISISLWPEFDWIGTEVETAANDLLREGDFIIASEWLWNKKSAHSSDYNLDPARVILQVDAPQTATIESIIKTRQKDVGGIICRGDSSLTTMGIYRAFCEDSGMIFADLEDISDVKRSRERRLSTERCHIYVVHQKFALRRKPEKAAKEFIDVAGRIRDEEQNVKIWINLSFKIEDNSDERILELIRLIEEHVDGVILNFKNSPNQTGTALSLLKTLRGGVEQVAAGNDR